MRILALLLLAFAATGSAQEVGTSPELKLETLSHGSFDLSQQSGKWVLVNFWATWCAPCLKEMPELDHYDQEHDDLEIIGLAFEETSPEELKAFLETRPVHYPIALIDVYAPPAGWDVPRGLPLSILVGPDGKVAKKFLGPITGKDLDMARAGSSP